MEPRGRACRKREPLMFDRIAIESPAPGREGTPIPRPPGAAHAEGPGSGRRALRGSGEIEAFLARVNFASQHGPVPPLGRTMSRARWDRWHTAWRVSPNWNPPGARRIVARGGTATGAGARRLLDEIAPERIRPGSRPARARRVPGRTAALGGLAPSGFFGMRQTPAVARGAVPLVVRLLAPSQRPCRPPATWRASGSASIRKCEKSWPGAIPSTPGRRTPRMTAPSVYMVDLEIICPIFMEPCTVSAPAWPPASRTQAIANGARPRTRRSPPGLFLLGGSRMPGRLAPEDWCRAERELRSHVA